MTDVTIEVKQSEELLCVHCGNLYSGRTCCGHMDFVECFEAADGQVITLAEMVSDKYVLVEEYST